MSRRETMYVLDGTTVSTQHGFEVDAERRARERGCQCVAPTYYHVLDARGPGTVVVYVDHAPWCPCPELGDELWSANVRALLDSLDGLEALRTATYVAQSPSPTPSAGSSSTYPEGHSSTPVDRRAYIAPRSAP